MGNWIERKLFELNGPNFNRLVNFQIPGIRVENFMPPETCEVISQRLRERDFQNYSHLKNIPVHQIGLCHNQYASEDKSAYFGRKQEAQKLVDKIYDGLGINPVEMVIEAIASRTNRQVDIFNEPGYGPYFAGAFRQFRGHGRLHVDNAKLHIQKPWAVTKITRQLTWNIYYSMSDSGGELIIYDTIHTAANDHMKVPGEYYFPYEVLESREGLRVQPKVGDLIIFNTHNFHEILGSPDGYRISQTSFIGQRKDNSLGLWS
jgi:hypothetical protein